MPGISNQPLTGYYETEYASEWPGLITSVPASRIPPGACVSCNAMVERGRLRPQPSLYPLTGTGGLNVSLPTLGAGENVCAFANLQIPGSQQGFTVFITTLGVYINYVRPGDSSKTFRKIYSFPTSFGRYARFGTQVIGNTLYFSSGSQLGVYALSPTYGVASVVVTNGGGYFTSAPTVVFSDGAGTGATATATLSGGSVASVAVTAAGSGYRTPPLITFSGGSASGPGAGQLDATAVGILSETPDDYAVREISASTGVAHVNVSAAGTGYVNPQVVFIGGGGTGAAGTAYVSSGGIVAVNVTSFGQNYTSAPTVQIVDSAGTGATATATLFAGKPFIGGNFMATLDQRLILGNIIGGDGNNTAPLSGLVLTSGGTGYTVPASVDIVGGGGSGATGSTTVSGGAIATITLTAGGNGYYQTPSVNIIATAGSGATAIAQVGSVPQAESTTTFYPDRFAWSAPNAYGYFDPYFGTAPGGYDTLTEARGLITSVNAIESVMWIGHNGGITEVTPNTSNSQAPFSTYPLWSADQGVVVRYGSMAQYGSLLAFLANDSAYEMSPSGLREIGQNISDLLRDAGIWNNGSYPLQGLYGSLIEIQGQKHYLVCLSSDDWDYEHGSSARDTIVYDFNLSENSWHQWSYPGYTLTCPIYQSFDSAFYAGANSSTEIAKDGWLLMGYTSSSNPVPTTGAVFSLNPSGYSGALPFGYVAQGTSYTYNLPIYNPGTSSLTISAATLTITNGNAGDYTLNGFTGSLVIASGAVDRSLSVTFRPTSAYETVETATLDFTSDAVSGTVNFNLSGISANPGSGTTYTPTNAPQSAAATQNNAGTTTEYSTDVVFASAAVPPSSVISVSLNYSAYFYPSRDNEGNGTAYFQYSTDGGSTWNNWFDWTSATTQSVSDLINSGTLADSFLNIDQLMFRVEATVTCNPGNIATISGTINSVSVTIGTAGDVYVQILEKDSSGDYVPPVLEFGTVTPGLTYTSNQITIQNPTSQSLSVTINADAAAGYSIINQTGPNPLPPNNGGQITFNVQLIPPSSGVHDDATAVSFSITGQTGPMDMESWYTTASSETATVGELATLERELVLYADSVAPVYQAWSVQFRTETPSIARISQERRIAVEYENLQTLGSGFTWGISFTLTGQQDPTYQTSSTGAAENTASTFNYTATYLSASSNLLANAINCFQQDFGTFAGVCISLGVSFYRASGTLNPFISLVRLTQINTLPKKEIT